MDTLWQDVRNGLRSLLRYRSYSLVVLLTLALGIGANTAIFSVVNGVLLRPLPYPDRDRLVMIWECSPHHPDEHNVITAQAPRVFLVNQSFARKFFPGQNPLGQSITVSMGDTVPGRIVGVVSD
ncbi:MAG TPA: hypothetical protein VLW54_10625, partial [Candidatus Acidoferrales bacterium]|nr:hypothetical protein [Candidatus Acidoferrales bacterium]